MIYIGMILNKDDQGFVSNSQKKKKENDQNFKVPEIFQNKGLTMDSYLLQFENMPA